MTKPPLTPEQAARAERLAASLRDNLKRRKQQARGRRADGSVIAPEGKAEGGGSGGHADGED